MFEQFKRVVEQGIDRQLHLGVQLSVSIGDESFEEAFGWHGPHQPLRPEQAVCWLSAAKPITAIAILQLFEQGLISLERSIQTYLTEFAGSSVGQIPLVQLLTHTSALREIATGWPQAEADQILQEIRQSSLKPEWNPQQRAAYLPSTSWFLLGAILERVTGTSFETHINTMILQPMGMKQTWAASQSMAPEKREQITLYDRVQGELQPSSFWERLQAKIPSPGASFCGPAKDLRLLFDMLRHRGQVQGQQVLEPETVTLMTERHRENLFDETLQHKVDYGLGVILDSNRYGVETVPYGFGRECSSSAFGHGGAQSTIAFADPERDRSVVIVANGRPGEGQHQRRFRQLLEALESDLKEF